MRDLFLTSTLGVHLMHAASDAVTNEQTRSEPHDPGEEAKATAGSWLPLAALEPTPDLCGFAPCHSRFYGGGNDRNRPCMHFRSWLDLPAPESRGTSKVPIRSHAKSSRRSLGTGSWRRSDLHLQVDFYARKRDGWAIRGGSHFAIRRLGDLRTGMVHYVLSPWSTAQPCRNKDPTTGCFCYCQSDLKWQAASTAGPACPLVWRTVRAISSRAAYRNGANDHSSWEQINIAYIVWVSLAPWSTLTYR